MNIIFCDGSFASPERVLEYQQALAGSVVTVKNLSELEKRLLSSDITLLLVLTAHVHPIHQLFIKRLMDTAPLPIIINAAQWQGDNVDELLACGRITFVPDELSASRLPKLVDLAKARFTSASKTQTTLKKLDSDIRTVKLVSQAKLILIQQGMSEPKAHEMLQKQAMLQGLSCVEMAQRIIALN